MSEYQHIKINIFSISNIGYIQDVLKTIGTHFVLYRCVEIVYYDDIQLFMGVDGDVSILDYNLCQYMNRMGIHLKSKTTIILHINTENIKYQQKMWNEIYFPIIEGDHSLISLLNHLIQIKMLEIQKVEQPTYLLAAQSKNPLLITDEPIYLKSEKNYTYIYTEKKKYVQKLSLIKMLGHFKHLPLVQVHKQYVVHKKSIKEVDFQKMIIKLANVEIPIGPSFKSNLILQYSM